MKRLIEWDGAQSIWIDTDANGVSTISTEQDAEPILEANKALANNNDYRKDGIKRSWMHLGTIPNGIINQMVIDTGLSPYSREGVNYLVKLIHDRDYKLLKVANGRFIRAGR